MLNEKNKNIENYLDGNMSQKESKDFEETMKKNSKLTKEVSIVREVNQTIAQQAKLKAFQEQLNLLNNDYFPTEEDDQNTEGVVRQLPNSGRRRWLVAASILILAISSVFIWNLLNNDLDSKELFASHYEPYGLGQRSNSTNSEQLAQRANKAYNNNNFKEAIPLFEELIKTTPSNEKNVLRLGSSYLSTNQPEKAINSFQQIVKNPESALIQAAQWYQALAYLQLEKNVEAKKILNTLSNSGNRTYPTKAKKLLKALD